MAAQVSRIGLLVTLIVCGVSFSAAARPMPGDAGVAGARRSLLQFFSGGGGFGGSRGTASLLGTLNAQSAVNAASGSGDPWTTYGATQSASRSAIAGAYGNLGYVSNQATFDRSVFQPYIYSPFSWVGRRR